MTSVDDAARIARQLAAGPNWAGVQLGTMEATRVSDGARIVAKLVAAPERYGPAAGWSTFDDGLRGVGWLTGEQGKPAGVVFGEVHDVITGVRGERWQHYAQRVDVASVKGGTFPLDMTQFRDPKFTITHPAAHSIVQGEEGWSVFGKWTGQVTGDNANVARARTVPSRAQVQQFTHADERDREAAERAKSIVSHMPAKPPEVPILERLANLTKPGVYDGPDPRLLDDITDKHAAELADDSANAAAGAIPSAG